MKWKIVLLAICSALAASSWFSSAFSLLPKPTSEILGLSAAVLGGSLIAHSAVTSLLEGVFGIDLLATVAVVASVVVGEYVAAAVVALMLGGGEVMESYASKRASKAIQKLIEDSPKTAIVIRDGKEVEVKVEDVKLEETVIVKPGEKVPVDGIVLKGQASINQASVTGESVPVEKAEGDNVYSGTIVELGALELKVSAVGEESTYGRIISMVREAEENRAPIERVADKYAKYFTPIILALGLGVFLYTRDPLRVASVFVIACPCALTLATPTAVIASIGNSARRGILIRNGESLEKLSKVNTLVLDKTGTITTGHPKVVDVKAFHGQPESEVIRLAATAERYSEHPIAQAILGKAEEMGLTPEAQSEFEVEPGLGVRVESESGLITVGNRKMLEKYSIPLSEEAAGCMPDQLATQNVVFVARDKRIVGVLCVSDALRDNVKGTLRQVKLNGIGKTVMLTGDNEYVAKIVGEQIGVDHIVSDVLPTEKVDYVRRLREEGHKVAMIGDGINDAPALAEADVGVAMGVSGIDVTIETAGVVLTSDNVDRFPTLLRIGRETTKIIKQNIAFAMAVNVLGIALSVNGLIPPLLASVIHESNALIAMFNSLRLLRVK